MAHGGTAGGPGPAYAGATRCLTDSRTDAHDPFAQRRHRLATAFIRHALVGSDARAEPGDVFILVHMNDEGQLVQVWEPAKVVGSRQIPGKSLSTIYLLRYNHEHEEWVVSDIDYALGEIQTLTGKDLRQREYEDKAVEISDAQGAKLIAALWG